MLTMQASGAPQTVLAFRSLFREFGDMSVLWERLGTMFYRIEAEQFDSQGGRGGGWAPLSPAYRRWKEVHFPGRPLMVLTGDLRSSMTLKGQPGNVHRVSPSAAAFGTEDVKAASHHFGRGGIPARPLIVINAQDEAAFAKLAEEWVAERVRQAGA